MKIQKNVKESKFSDFILLKHSFRSEKQAKSQWKLIYKEYKRNSNFLREKYLSLLSQEIITKKGKNIFSLANIFKDIANSNIKLAQSFNTNPSLKLQYYNDAAIACHHGLNIIKKANNSNDTEELCKLEASIYHNLNFIQVCMVNTCEGDLEYIEKINDEININNISKRNIIENIRSKAIKQLKIIETAKEQKKDEEYLEQTTNLFKTIASEMENYLATLYQEAEIILGNPPCDYTVIGLGSMALRQMTPYSDLEFAILTANDEYKHSHNFKIREYFKNLTQIVHFKVINLGETKISISSYNLNFNEFIQTAVNFDLGGKTPLGRIDKPYELIQTVEGMLNYLRNKKDRIIHTDKSLIFILQKICLIYKYGKSNLATEYQNQVHEFLQLIDSSNGRPYCENRAVQILLEGGVEMDYTKPIPELQFMKGNLEQFSFNIYSSRGKLFDLKQEIYRMPDRFIYNLGLIFGIQEDSTWDTLDKLYENNLISSTAALNLKKALCFATNLRLKAYSHYGYQKDTMDYSKIYNAPNTTNVAEEIVQEKLIQKELKEVFKLKDKDLEPKGALFEYYYTILSLLKKLKEFCDLQLSSSTSVSLEQNKMFFKNDSFRQNDSDTKANIYLRLLHYSKALPYQLKALVIKQKSLGAEHLDIANSLHCIGNTYNELGDYNKALEYQTKALKVRKKSLGEYHLDVADSLQCIGLTYLNLVNYNKTLKYQKEALIIKQKILGEGHPSTATSLNNIGSTYDELGDYNKALEYQTIALKVRKKSLGEYHLDVANSLNNIGCIYRKLGNYDKALEYQTTALKVRKKSLGEYHPFIANSLSNIGGIYGKLGNHNKALEYQTKALKIRKKLLGNNHPFVANSLSNIGGAYVGLNNYDKALAYETKALKIMHESLGEDHPDVAFILNNIGGIYGKLGNHNKALEYEIKALEIMHKSLGEDHPDVAFILNNIGGTYGKLGNHNKALEYREKSLLIMQKTLGEDHPYILTILNNIGSLYRDLKNYNEALKYQKEVSIIKQKTLGEDHPDVASSLNNIGMSYESLSNYNEALVYRKQALIILQKSLGEDHLDVVTNLNNIGNLYMHLNNYDKALEYQTKALKIMHKSLGEDHPGVVFILNNIGITYMEFGNYDKALEYQTKALKIRRKLLGEDHPDVATNLNNIGIIYGKLGNYNKSIEFFKQVLMIYQTLYQYNHPDIADLLEDIGITYNILGNIVNGLVYQEQSLVMYLALYQDKHLVVAHSLINVGNTYVELDNKLKALELYKQSYYIRLKIVGEEHPVTREIKNKINSLSSIFYEFSETRICILERGIIHQFILDIKHKIQKSVLNNIYELVKDNKWSCGLWTKNASILGDWGIKGYLDNKYLRKILDDLADDYAIDIAQMLCFEIMCLSIMSNKNKNLNCIIEFKKAYPNLLNKIIVEHPEYMVDGLIVRECVTDYETLVQLLGKDNIDIETINQQITLLSSEGVHAYKKQNYEEAIIKYNLASELIDKILDHSNILNIKVSLYFNIARAHHNNGNLQEALKYYNETYQLNDNHIKAKDYFYEIAKILYQQFYSQAETENVADNIIVENFPSNFKERISPLGSLDEET